MQNYFRVFNKDLMWLGGVCAGFSCQTGIPAWIIRIITILLLVIIPKIIVISYLLVWIFANKKELTVEEYNSIMKNKSNLNKNEETPGLDKEAEKSESEKKEDILIRHEAKDDVTH